MDPKARVKIAPHSKESEMMVLGCMLTSINSLNIAADQLEEDDFYFPEHKLIFDVLKGAYRQDKPADVHLVCEELKRKERLQTAGGASYVTTLAQYAGTSAYIEEYVEIVRSKAILRRMIQASQVIEKKALEEPSDVAEALDDAQKLFFNIGQSTGRATGIELAQLIAGKGTADQQPFLKALQERQERFRTLGPEESKVTGIPTHFLDLDKMLNGLNDSNLMILAGRPAMGKTALALNVAQNICFRGNLPVGVFSLEMSAEQLMKRLICSEAQVESEKIQTGALTGAEFQRIVSSVAEMQNHTMIIDDQPGLKITDLKARARRMKETHDIRLLVIDYLQLLSGSGSARTMENRQAEISEISRSLKTLARELNVPILCPSQLSRKVEERAGHRPMLSDLRESGCLTGDALITDHLTGLPRSIESLAERPNQSLLWTQGIDPNFHMGPRPMIKAFYSGKKVVYTLATLNGFTITASGNHPFLIPGIGLTWKRLDELVTGEQIAVFKDGVQGWDSITSIKEVGERDVFDATVPGVHNFVSNGLIVHNSIEQDSDIVMFLLRREYYDPNDKPGMAEVIVAKNRHGGVGSVHLSFIKELVQFRNYTPIQVEVGDDSPFAELGR